jgi:hypothetical protein
MALVTVPRLNAKWLIVPSTTHAVAHVRDLLTEPVETATDAAGHLNRRANTTSNMAVGQIPTRSTEESQYISFISTDAQGWRRGNGQGESPGTL